MPITLSNINGTGGGFKVVNNTNSGGFAMAVKATTYTIGQSALGGKIAYILQPGDTGYDANQQHGLVAYDGGLDNYKTWGCYGTLIAGTSDAIGTGQANSNLIIAGGCSVAGTAINFADTLTVDDYSDWYLPSYNELQQIYNNNALLGLDTFSTYWSSTDIYPDAAKAINFAFGSFTNLQKNIYAALVVAVRSF